MSSFSYRAKIAPIGKDISMPGDKPRPLVLDEATWKTWVESPWHVAVRVGHDPGNVGQLMLLRVRDGWYEGEFFLTDAIERNLPEGLPVGQPVSVGMRHVHTSGSGILLLQEISIVNRGAIRGAEIISRRERKTTRTSSSAVTPKPEPKQRPAMSAGRWLPSPKPLNAKERWLKKQDAPATGEWWRTPKGQDAELRRRLDATDYRDFEGVLEQMRDEMYFMTWGVPHHRLQAVA